VSVGSGIGRMKRRLAGPVDIVTDVSIDQAETVVKTRRPERRNAPKRRAHGPPPHSNTTSGSGPDTFWCTIDVSQHAGARSPHSPSRSTT